ncbi:tRNA lysidine(34) synthetase TilS [Adlercreutzia sp. ZJ242]|uniref:tRNA lysidine(34) synthetase TilS n=1 Tax=Adlercreutzia sp. ZJ242 TaxID=2709409 RepID=UPI0013EAE27D|nr:tRNA lysidine(34) synthetase TilS [Adlercreutzia sp. ZJ242]
MGEGKASETIAARVIEQARRTMADHALAGPDTAALLMVSGGSDSTALAYVASELRAQGALGALAMLHVNHKLRGEDADDDARFVAELAHALDIPLFQCEIDIAAEAARTHENVEAVARRERYLAANEALRSMCQHEAYPLADGRIFTAHTADDRIESFYMRSIVGTGPGGFRSMRYRNGPVVRPMLDLTRDELRSYLHERERAGQRAVCDAAGELWREDATNAHTDRFRAFVRHNIVARAKEWDEHMPATLMRSMNLIADEDDMLEEMAARLVEEQVAWAAQDETWGIDLTEGFVLQPGFGASPRPLQRRAVRQLLLRMLGAEARVEAASVEAVLDGFDAQTGAPAGGYVANIQSDLAVSANKQGVRVEPMAYFRARRKKRDAKAEGDAKAQKDAKAPSGSSQSN